MNSPVFILSVSSMAVVLILLLVSPQSESPLVRAWMDSGHMVLFAAFTIFSFSRFRVLLVKQRPTCFNRLCLTVPLFFILMFCFGAGIELLQVQIGRVGSWSDMAMNMVGVAAGLCFLMVVESRKRLWQWLGVVGIVTTLGFASLEPLRWLQAMNARDRLFPTLVDMEADTGFLVKGNYETQISSVKLNIGKAVNLTDGSRDVLAVQFLASQAWSGWRLEYPYPDWSDYSELLFTVFSGRAMPVDITIRIDDVGHDNRYADRFNKKLSVDPGVNYFSIPLDEIRKAPEGREMDMTRISQVIWFSVQPKSDFVLYFSDVKLR